MCRRRKAYWQPVMYEQSPQMQLLPLPGGHLQHLQGCTPFPQQCPEGEKPCGCWDPSPKCVHPPEQRVRRLALERTASTRAVPALPALTLAPGHTGKNSGDSELSSKERRAALHRAFRTARGAGGCRDLPGHVPKG